MSADPANLSPSGRRALARIADLLLSGFSGKLELECEGGGVRMMRQSTVEQFKDERVKLDRRPT